MKTLEKNRLVFLIVAIAFSMVFATGCSDLFEVDNPNYILEEDLNDTAFIEALGNSAEGALSQNYSWWIVVAGMPTDEVIAQQTEQGGARFTDIGLIDDHQAWINDAYDNLAAARWTVTSVTQRLLKIVENPATSIEVAKSYFWDGIARITLADMFRKITFDNGPPHTPEEVYEGAIELLKKAAKIAKASDSEESALYEAASYASIARVYRSLYFERDGDDSSFSEAVKYAKKALQIDPEFSLMMEYQAPGSENEIYLNFNQGSYYKMGPKFGHIKDTVSGIPDPRVKHSTLIGYSNLRGDEIFHQLKYPNGNSDIPISRWQEAELIIAEYEVLLGIPGNAIGHINRVRNATGLPDFSSSDPVKIYDQIKYERKAEFFLELRRWQDMRYYNIVPDIWKPGAKAKGVDRRYPISIREIDANPNV
ncbi:MAG TPA: RagB/SusD family nutrient uptake outer membrane protein [Balneolaceae bacterium]